MSSMQSVEDILKRNARVEIEKAWETSWTRRLLIASVTYGAAAIFMWRIGVPDYFFNALVPTGGYVLSTLSLPFIKQWWVKTYYARRQ